MNSKSILLTLLLLGAGAIALRAEAPETQPGQSGDHVPDGKGIGTAGNHGPAGQAAPGAGKNGNGIFYHGGPLMLGAPMIYYIWYGNWAGNTAPAILEDLAANLGGSPYYGINTTYYDGANNHVSNAAAFGGSAYDNYSRGTALTDADIRTIVDTAINSNALPFDDNAVYFVLTSADVNETSGFCTSYCGWHTHGAVNGINVKYSFVGNPERCPSACEAQSASSPNGNPGADGMASIIAHEFEESASDPDLNAWYNRRGQENADMCAWTFGTTQTGSDGSKYNMTLGTKNYLIQRNWVNAGGGYCALKYP